MPQHYKPRTYRGVTFKRPGQWNVRMKAHGRNYHLGSYHDMKAAARVYDFVARRVHGREAVLNFPDENELPRGVLLADIMLLMKRKGLL